MHKRCMLSACLKEVPKGFFTRSSFYSFICKYCWRTNKRTNERTKHLFWLKHNKIINNKIKTHKTIWLTYAVIVYRGMWTVTFNYINNLWNSLITLMAYDFMLSQFIVKMKLRLLQGKHDKNNDKTQQTNTYL